ncbi:hypothetical protein ENSA5_29820 [Enhygromyxa salina]|uniref:Uncharacterized protein n=1 Tax=Enhygromyxa salina TaxID=215803 RepID=A0A2S9Y075_9BACT|nr:hypothetical protein [Enhygromyxa salina]PRP98512.1 hypothetical protein ENSA5_29820 [Enhygromyxa salina]
MYQPGQSPFHTRGTTYMGIRDYAVKRVPGGMAQLGDALPDAAYRAFSSQMFVGIGWYDALPIRTLTEAVAKLEGKTWADSVRSGSMDVARRDLNIFRRVLFKAVSPERVVERLQAATMQHFNFGETEIVESEVGHSAAIFHGVPEPVGEWFLTMLQGYASVLITTAGGHDPVITGEVVLAGHRDGVDLVDVNVDLRWNR